MYQKSLLSKAIGLAIVFGTSSAAVVAQAAEAGANEAVERIEVTGSRIKRVSEVSPTPVTVISGADLTESGVTNVADLLNELPNATVGISPETSNNTIFANGLNNTDLRGLGSNRTLVLVNGRRYVAGSPGSAAVDLNNIPTAIIERIEIATGGASAVYGSDAMAGVVNIVTKKSFDGIEVDVATTQPEQSGGEETSFSLTFGNEADKSSYIVNLTYVEQEQLRGADRDFVRNGIITMDNPANTGPDDGIPGRIVFGEGSTSLRAYAKTGDFWAADGNHYVFADDGSLRLFENEGILPAGPAGSRNSNYYTGQGDGYSFLEHKYLRTPLTRLNFNTIFNYELAGDHQMTFESTYSRTSAHGESSPIFLGFNVAADNAFFSDQTQQFFADQGMNSVRLSYLGDAFGHRKYDQEREMVRGALGFEGYLNDNWSYDTYAQIGRVSAKTKWQGEILEENFYNALDAVNLNGSIVCADRNDAGDVVGALAGCAPANIFGKNLVSQDALDYITTTAMRDAVIKQTVVGGTVTGDLLELPAGPLATAVTAEYRKEESSTTPDTAMRKGLIFGNTSDPMEGEFSVREMAVEFAVPLLADLPLVQDLVLETAYRYMDYSTVGSDYAWKVSLNYEMNDDVRFRVNRSKSVRAPNIGELYSPKGQTFRSFSDPCSALEINKGGKYVDNIIANCAAAGIPVGWEPSDDWKKTNHSGYTLGNTELDNEVAYDTTIGVVYTPSFMDDFSITLDYWTFDLSKAITSPTGPSIVANCYQLDSLDNPYCGLIERNPVTHEIDAYYEKPVNAASNSISGYDFEMNYGLETDIGLFDLRLLATYLKEREYNATGLPDDLRVTDGEYDWAKWKGRFQARYSYDDLELSLIANYRHHTVNDKDWTVEDNSYNRIASYTTFDLTSRYQVTDDLQLRLGVLNLADREPPRSVFSFDDGAYYDILGRRLVAGVNYRF